ncbi:MAG: DUF4340 domain-containing protein [Magnetococcales bacterium]|nr:DUF4340 domain-containing protein [Magnetococcales bacterium]NGZ06727.1 DUF4340 domain-containing protein [Magnetococcales bacterium]
MSKGWRNNLILAAVVALAGGGLWLLDSREKAKEEADKQARLLSTLKADAIRAVEFQDGAGTQLTLTKEGEGKWQITAPTKLRTQTSAVQGLLDLMQKNYEKKVAESWTDPVPYGLATPAARMQLTDGSGGKALFLIGGAAPANAQKRYVSLGEKGPVVLMAQSDLSRVMQRAEDLRDKRLAMTNSQDLTRIRLIQSPGQELAIQKDKEGGWHLETPFQDQADPNRISAWIFALTGTQGTAFQPVTGPVASKSGEKPEEWRVELTPTQGDPETIIIQRLGEELVSQRPGEPDRMVLPKYLAEELNKNALELVAMRPVSARNGLEALRLEMAGKTLHAEKQAGKWPKNEWGEIEEMLMRDAHRGVARLTSATPWVTVTHGTGDQARTLTLHQVEKSLIVSPPDRPVSLELTPLQAETLQKAITALLAPPST